MRQRINNILFVVCVVMVFIVQTGRADDKDQKHAPEGRSTPAVHSAPEAHYQSRSQVQTRREAPQQHVDRQSPPEQTRTFQQPQQRREEGPRVYAVPASAPVENDRLFHHQHHNHWQPLYNFYDNQYHFYPYVNVTSLVELSAGCVAILFNGQTYYYDRGSFYVRDSQGYLAVPPPIGIIVSVIPQHARQISVDGQVYYRYKGVCYIQVAQGYQVVQQVGAASDAS